VDARQAAEVRKPAGDRGLMARRLDHRGDLRVAACGLAAAEIDDAVIGIDLPGEVIGAAVGARRMARDQIEDVELVFDRAEALFDGAGFAVTGHHALPGCWSGEGSCLHTTTVNRFAARVTPV